MTKEALQIAQRHLLKHKSMQNQLEVDDSMVPIEKQAIREERKIEDAIVDALEELYREMMRN